MKFFVEQWAPEYGAPVDPGALEDSQAPVNIAAEVPVEAWAPITPSPMTAIPKELAFVDGVRRVEARVWVEGPDGTSHQGICASYAAGVVRCNGKATVVEADVERGFFCAGPSLEPIETKHGRFAVKAVAETEALDPLSLALQGAMGSLEHRVSGIVPDDVMLIVDGPLRDRRHLSHAVGYVKTHQASYLPATVSAVIAALAPGQRTPIFLAGDRFSRWSWYQRLPGDSSHGWAGIVRCEASPDKELDDVRSIADACALALPRFASEAHKDPRAPQNLYPIGGLERELRRRLGDPRLLYRSLRAAA